MPDLETSPIHFVSPEARKAFEEILLGQVEGLVSSEWQAVGVKTHFLELLSEAQETRNALYNMLIRHKPLNNTDQVFFTDLEYAVRQWAFKWVGR